MGKKIFGYVKPLFSHRFALGSVFDPLRYAVLRPGRAGAAAAATQSAQCGARRIKPAADGSWSTLPFHAISRILPMRGEAYSYPPVPDGSWALSGIPTHRGT